MGLILGNAIFVILEPLAFKKYSICWVFQAFSVQLFFYVCFATRSRASLTAVFKHPESLQCYNVPQCRQCWTMFCHQYMKWRCLFGKHFPFMQISSHGVSHMEPLHFFFGSPGNHKQIDWHQNLGFSSDTFAF